MAVVMNGEVLQVAPEFRLVRSGRFLVAELLVPHRVLSTSAKNGGQREGLRWLVNHQSCEGTDHRERHAQITGGEAYHDSACREIALDPAEVAMMQTAANMNYAAIVAASDLGATVTAIVTAGVHGNAACAGDPASWREIETGWEKVAASVPGTINTMLLINHALTEGALARAVITMTEAKSAALQRLAVRSLYSADFATGTGTDQYCIAARLVSEVGSGEKEFTSTSPHSKLGELIGVAARDATAEALRWQNGLEISSTRLLFHALGRYGVREADCLERLAPLLSERELELLKKNFQSVVYEPKVAAAAYAIAAVLDRIRVGTLPGGAARDVFRQQVATLAASLAAKPDAWPEFYVRLADADPSDAARGAYAAIAMGWSEKWR
ncbi:MAG TPA: adenosylcobinamide amidohydrolase [Candidatus Sulfotelmatobacter sp.]|nr:adenosylcobinamide amidohydrolase [Candidatus Sulfotelmatobacter sp.]